MTSTCLSLSFRIRQFLRLPMVPLLAGVLFVALSGGCRYQAPTGLNSPWLPRQQVWAVAPLANESGVSSVDRLAITDSLILETASIEGVDVLPLNRTLDAMLALQIGLDGIPTVEEYQVLLQTIGADAIIVGTVIAYDPYQPLRLGASIQLIQSPSANQTAFDPRALTLSISDHMNQAHQEAPTPLIQASGIYDAENHGVLIALESYAKGRSTHDLARSGVGLYLLDMDEYSEFVFHELLSRLVVRAQIAMEAAMNRAMADASS